MAWFYLLFAGVLEIAWAFAMKQSDGFTKRVPTAVTLAALVGSLVFLALALKSLPLGIAYTVWTGIGALGALAVGVLLLGEPLHALKAGAAAMILGGLVLLKAAS
ncbi:MAG: multidrug efflux SMR transporter [Rhizobiales bacterium]|nr:multidrug efflux SMR transporter [Hyphomicrobiales bacterium]